MKKCPCIICGYRGDNARIFTDEKGRLSLCASCEAQFFFDVFTAQDIRDRCAQAKATSREHNISFRRALNVVTQKYSLKEAQERSSKKDITAVFRRRPGSFS